MLVHMTHSQRSVRWYAKFAELLWHGLYCDMSWSSCMYYNNVLTRSPLCKRCLALLTSWLHSIGYRSPGGNNWTLPRRGQSVVIYQLILGYLTAVSSRLFKSRVRLFSDTSLLMMIMIALPTIQFENINRKNIRHSTVRRALFEKIDSGKQSYYIFVYLSFKAFIKEEEAYINEMNDWAILIVWGQGWVGGVSTYITRTEINKQEMEHVIMINTFLN